MNAGQYVTYHTALIISQQLPKSGISPGLAAHMHDWTHTVVVRRALTLMATTDREQEWGDSPPDSSIDSDSDGWWPP